MIEVVMHTTARVHGPSRHRIATCPGGWIPTLAAICLAAGCISAPLRAQQVALPAALVQDEQQRIDTIARVTPAVVCIFGPENRGGGSGVLISPDGYVVTNFHVVQSCRELMTCGLADGATRQAVIVGLDPTGDLALIKLLGDETFPFVTLADSDQVRMGDSCFSAGNPFLLATDFQPSISWGMISGTHRYQYPSGTILEYTDCLQTDAAVNPGNSGGPLFDIEGNLVGINGRCSFEKRGRVNVGVGYAISSNQVGHFLSHLQTGRLVDHASAEFTVTQTDPGIVRIDQLLEQSQAFHMGVRPGDRLLEFAGRRIKTVNEFKNALGIYPQDFRVPVVFETTHGRVQFPLRLRGVHHRLELQGIVAGQMGPPADAPQRNPTDPQTDGSSPFYESRQGFANYHFQKVALQRLVDQYRPAGLVDSIAGTWQIECTDAQGQPVLIVLDDQQAGFRSNGNTTVIAVTEGPTEQDESPAADLLRGLSLWRASMLSDPKTLGDVQVLGEVPGMPYCPSAIDMRLIRDGDEWHFLFDSQSGRLAAIEQSAASGSMQQIHLQAAPTGADSRLPVWFPASMIYGRRPGPLAVLSVTGFQVQAAVLSESSGEN